MNNLFILGDSYSTYINELPGPEYAHWYHEENDETDVHRVEDTWWHMLISERNLHLVRNDSWSGTTICNTGYGGCDVSNMSFIGRIDKLIDEGYFNDNVIDTFMIFGGTNDDWAGSPLGEPVYGDFEREELFKILPAMSYLLFRVKSQIIPGRIIVILNSDMTPAVVDGLEAVSKHYNVETIRLHEIGKNSGHPNMNGMTSIKNQILEIL